MPAFSNFLTLGLILFNFYQMTRMFMVIDDTTSDSDYNNMYFNWQDNQESKEPAEPAARIIDVPDADDSALEDRKVGKNYFPLHVLVCLPDNKYENKTTNYFKLSSLAAKPVIDVAFRSVVKRGILPMGSLDIMYKDSNLSDVYGPWWPIEALLRNQLDCIMGYATNYELGPVARTSWLYKNRKGVPVLTTIGLVDVLDNRDVYKMLFRMSGSYSRMAQFLLDFMKTHNWNKVLYLFQENIVKDSSLGKHECFHQAVALYRQEVRMTHKHKKTVTRSVDPNLLDYNYTQLLIDLSMDSNIIVVCGSPSLVRKIMLTAHSLGMTQSGEYVFVNIDVSVGSNATKPWYRSSDSQAQNDKAREAFKAMKIISLRKSQRPDFADFEQKVRETAETVYNYTKITGKPYELNPFISAFYEAVLLYSIAVNETLAAGHDPTNGVEITKRMWNRTFEGITGEVSITQSGDRNIDYAMLDYNTSTDQFEEKAYWSGAEDKWMEVGEWFWVGGSIPKDTPVCGYDKSKCPQKGLAAWAWSLIALGIATVIFSIVSFFIHRHYKLEAELAAMTWRIRWEELTGERKKSEKRPNDSFWGFTWGQPTAGGGAPNNFPGGSAGGSTVGAAIAGNGGPNVVASVPVSGSAGSLGHHSTNLARSESEASLTRASLASEETIVINEATQQIFTKTAIYKGAVVAIKKLSTSKQKIEVSRAMLLELKKMKDLQHDHITRFVGACIDIPHACIVTEYCPKGSLEDILENDEIKLDKMMIYSLLHDLVKGMYFIHSSDVRSHGNLKSSNCVVDSRFVLKITDFGLQSLHAIEDKSRESVNSYQIWRSKLWTAPEILRVSLDKHVLCGTQKGDVYSFGIILHEMAFRQGVFYIDNENPSPQDIVSRVILRQQPPFRPSIDDPNADESLVQLMTKSWADDPAERPDFSTIRKQVRLLNKKFETSSNIVDNLLKRMEQYATNLEGLVEERTAAYLEEKRKAENLLYQLLPQSVASELIQGKPVTAESFDSVTIYFSDIVGFTSICSSSTPMEVVTLLGDLYTCFDTTIEHFDVYKVETIGDAYMVVSGLPRRNGNRHAYEIGRMSLALLNKVKTFRIRHRPNDSLNLRIGLHTGSVCAGVVGLKMPRYCLFGDAVNTASRMESNGLPLKIHLSQDTKEILESFGCFQMELRGQVEMKGKGTQTTYWLLGEYPNIQPCNLSPPSEGAPQPLTQGPHGSGAPPDAGAPLTSSSSAAAAGTSRPHQPQAGGSGGGAGSGGGGQPGPGILKTKNSPMTTSSQQLASAPSNNSSSQPPSNNNTNNNYNPASRRSNPNILLGGGGGGLSQSDSGGSAAGPSATITFSDTPPSTVRYNADAALLSSSPPPPYQRDPPPSSNLPNNIC